jgi:hypothetical protein
MIGGCGALVVGGMSLNSPVIIAGLISIVSCGLFFGLAEFFQQVTRITAATEETARLLRNRPSS